MHREGIFHNSINTKIETNIKNIDTLVFYICIIDILFLPYVRIISASISMVVLPIWYLFNFRKIRIGAEFKLFILLFFLVVLSYLISLIKFPFLGFISNLVPLVIVIYAFLYYFFFKYYLENFRIDVSNFLKTYLGFVFMLAILYIINPDFFFIIRTFWTMNGNLIDVDGSLLIHRFTSTFSDPNNAATAVVAVFTFLLINPKLDLKTKLFSFLATLIIVSSTMSTTGILLLGLILCLYVLVNIKKIVTFNGRIKVTTLYSLLLVMFFLPIFLYIVYSFMGTDVAQSSIERSSTNSADSRLGIWKNLLEDNNIFIHFLYGMGGTIFVDGISRRPHNGHFHLIYNYGWIVYIIFMYVFFRIRKNVPIKNFLYIFPLFVGFTMNVGIYEPRFANLLALLVAIYACEQTSKKSLIKSA